MVLASAKVREGKELSNTAYIPPLCSCHSVFPLPKLQYYSDKLESCYITHGVLVKLKGGSVINTDAFSCNGVFVKTFSFLTRQLRNFAKINGCHSAIVQNVPISLIISLNQRLKGPYYSKKNGISEKKKIADIFY